MSDDVNCDCCGKVGWRKRFKIAPPDWYYIEAPNDSEDPTDTIYVYACSSACARNIWKKGPGDLREPSPWEKTEEEKG